MKIPPRRVSTATARAVAFALALMLTQQATAGAAAPTLDPGDLDLGSAQQVVIVTAPSWQSRTGQVSTYERTSDGPWRQVLGPMPAMLGFSGLIASRDRRQGTGKTPTGTFRIVSAFGRKANPGTAMPYRQVDRDDVWTYHPRSPSTYNMMQTVKRSWRSYGGYVEHLWSYGVQYDYVAVLDYNLPPGPIARDSAGIRRAREPADTRRGGGIFLHASNGKVTAGCIAVPVGRMRAITRWLDPEQDPRIVIRVVPT